MTRKQEKFYRKYFKLGMTEEAALKALNDVFSTKTLSIKQKKNKIKYLLSQHAGIIYLEELKEKAPHSTEKVERQKEIRKSSFKKGNKLGIRTGEFEKIFYESLTEKEIELLEHLDLSRKAQIEGQLAIITVREYRMLERIDRYNETADGLLLAYQESSDKDGRQEIKERREAAIKTVMNIEEALTRVQQSKMKVIRELARYEETGTGEEEQQTALDKLIAAQDEALGK